MYNLTRLKNEMFKRGWNEPRLAKKAGVAQQTVNRMFKVGSAHPDTVRKVAKALGLELEDLVIEERSA